MTVLAVAILFLTIGVLVGVWLRGLIPSDSTAYAVATPSEPPQTPPTSTPVAGYLADLLDISGKRLAKIRTTHHSHRLFCAGMAWDHIRTDSYGRWQYQPVESLTLAQKRQLHTLQD